MIGRGIVGFKKLDKEQEEILRDIQANKAKVTEKSLGYLEKPIRDKLETVFILVWHWNKYERLENYSRVHPTEFLTFNDDEDVKFNGIAKKLNQLFWQIAEVTIIFHDLENWPYNSEDELLEFSDLDYYQDFEFEYDILSMSELFELGRLYERVDIYLTNKYGDGYLPSYIEEIESKLNIRINRERKFSKSGTDGGISKGNRAFKSVSEYITRNCQDGIENYKPKSLAYDMFSRASDLAEVMSEHGLESEIYLEHEYNYLFGIIHPLVNKDGRPSDSKKKGKVYSSDRLQKLIAKYKRELSL